MRRGVGVAINLREAATELQISTNTARRWIKSGKLKATLIEGVYGQEYKIEETELARIKEESQQRTTIVHTINNSPNIEVPASWLLKQLEESITNVVRGQIEHELNNMREENTQLKGYIETRLEERDKKLVNTMKSILESRQTKKWWEKIFK